MFEQLEKKFYETYGKSNFPVKAFFVPGRVNLIGEHIDYCGGKVLPATLQMATYAIARKTGDSIVRMKSTFRDKQVDFSVESIKYASENDWGNYPMGVFNEYASRCSTLEGAEILFYGNIPGGGLSSSASLEICTALIIESLNSCKLDKDPLENRKQMAWLCQHAENTFNGVNCGIMDQAAIALGKEKKAILMDCSNLDISYVDMELGEHEIIIMDSCKKRTLAASKYNERRQETEQALEILQNHFEITNLCDLTIEQLPQVLEQLDSDLLKIRTRHVITENNRVLKAYKALGNNDLKAFGELMNDSHLSLKNDFEVTGIELDSLFNNSIRLPGVLGARMTGGGFGGCAIALVNKKQSTAFKAQIEKLYTEEIGYPPKFYSTKIGYEAKECVF
ncbi:MAG: galactokinase [Deltaproteobacteria bacterium]|jgi:galactokinase|nr:galactokinase [Deltaproteobacteria bacterium]